MISMELNLQIRQLRKDRNLTLKELAERVGISAPHLSEVERGKKNVNNHILTRIANALDVPPKALIGDNDDDDDDWAQLKAIVQDLSQDDVDRLTRFAEGLAGSASSKQPR
jgi:transcriptional regulator with XRE-family HTH domain